LIVKEISDREEIEKIFFDPEIYERIKISEEKPDLPTDNTKYIGGYHKGELIGIVVYYVRKEFTTCHIQVLKAHRAALAVKFARMALKLTDAKVLYTNIPKKFEDVIRFAKYFDFKLLEEKNDILIFKRG
jgi:hypothetical protein